MCVSLWCGGCENVAHKNLICTRNTRRKKKQTIFRGTVSRWWPAAFVMENRQNVARHAMPSCRRLLKSSVHIFNVIMWMWYDCSCHGFFFLSLWTTSAATRIATGCNDAITVILANKCFSLVSPHAKCRCRSQHQCEPISTPGKAFSCGIRSLLFVFRFLVPNTNTHTHTRVSLTENKWQKYCKQ